MSDEQSNGSNGKSRLDRIEAALELMIADHEEFRAEHKMLLKSQVVMQEVMEKGFTESRRRMDEMEDKLNGVIGVVDQLTQDVTQITKDVGELRQSVGELRQSVGELTRNVEAMRADTDRRLRRLEG